MAITTAAEGRSEGSGAGSTRSSAARKYRVVSRGSDVDESLFGRSNGGGEKALKKKVLLRDVPPAATVITENELKKMKGRAVITSLAEEEAARVAREKDLQEKQKAARARKQRMLEMEVEAKKKAFKSDIEVEQMAHDAIVKKMAKQKLDANNDMVKKLHSLGARAAAFTIRDKQLLEKQKHEGEAKVYEERMDMIMEVDRLKDLTRRDAESQERKKKRIEDRKVITEQIEARRLAKLVQLEATEQEGRAMVKVIQRYADEDKAMAEKRALEMKKARALVMAANEEAIYQRKTAKLKEREEVEAILAYQAMKDEEMRLREVEESEKQQMMKARQQKLLDGQQRDMDKRAELDELRARRAAEEKEREMRQREKSAAEKRRKDTQQLQADRRRQADMKNVLRAREALREEEEYEAAVRRGVEKRYNAGLSERERREDAARHAANMEHRKAILLQVQEAEDKRRAERAAKFEEGRRIKNERIIESMKLEAMRDNIVEDLEKRGIITKLSSSATQFLQRLRNM